MKSSLFFIPVALLVLGYLHLLTITSRIESHVSTPPDAPVVTADDTKVMTHEKSTSILITRPQLSAAEARRQMEQANEAVPPMIHPIEGNPVPAKSSSIDAEDADARAQRVVYIITPTHKRMTQRIDLMRLRQTLQLASLQHHAKVYWILIEDAPACSQHVRTILEGSGLTFAHQSIQYNKKDFKGKNNPGHRGLAQRNLGLDIVQQVGVEGVIYFADDDNAYDAQLITELTHTRYASIFAVGMSGGSAWERCHVNNETGKVDAILSTWKPRFRIPVKGQPNRFTNPIRKFSMDMAGFALSTTALVTTRARFQPETTSGMLETDFLSMLVDDVSELEPLAANCTRVLVWHVKTVEPQHFNNPEADDRTFELMRSLV